MLVKATATVKSSVLAYAPYPYLLEGRDIEVVRGLLQGEHGIILRKKKRQWLALCVHLIQRAVEINAVPT
jgi:hypothetical protein